MSDLDAELLALAGDDSSDEEGSQAVPHKSASPPPASSSAPHHESDQDTMGRKGIAKPVTTARKRAAPKKVRKSVSEEEDGEV